MEDETMPADTAPGAWSAEAQYQLKEVAHGFAASPEQEEKWRQEKIAAEREYRAREAEDRALQRRHTALSLAIHHGQGTYATPDAIVANARAFDAFLAGTASTTIN